jgi:hypothetical protein
VSPLSLGQALFLYTWFPLAALLFFLLLIARFYQKFSHKRTLFRLYVVPMFLFGVGAVRYSSINRFGGDLLGDGVVAAGGLLLLFLCAWLYWQMLYGLHQQES